MPKPVQFTDLGTNRSYKAIWDFQESLLQQNVLAKAAAREQSMVNPSSAASIQIPLTNNRTTNHLLFVEHSPVYTLGKSGDICHVLLSEEELKQKHIEFYRINRGGDITFHGPQQLVGYPIIDLEQFKTDLGWYLRSLEEVIILTMAEYGLKGERSKGETGVWLDPDIKGKERKICAMGIRCSRWITMHGFAFNINTPLEYFDYIVPCGIKNKKVTSLKNELGADVPMNEVKQIVKKKFELVFEVALYENQ